MPSPYRKACNRCAAAKRKCDLALPRCHRCESRHLHCQYDGISPAATDGNLEDLSLANDAARIGDLGAPDLLGFIATVDSAPAEDGQLDSGLPSMFGTPDFNLDWSIIMTNIEDYAVPDRMEPHHTEETSVIAGEIYQERIVYTVKRLKTFPNQFVQSCQTAFIHKSLYKDYMPLVLQDTLALCALYGQKNEHNEATIHRVICQKAKDVLEIGLVTGSTAIDQLATVQALSLLRIMQLFDGDVRLRGEAERAESTFTSMLRQIQSRMEHLGGNESQVMHLSSTDGGITAVWQSWLFAESLRRTIITGWSLNGLYCFLKNGWDNCHHEFDHLSFYAQTALWDASSEYKWSSAAKKKRAFPVRFIDWDLDVANMQPVDIEDLGMMMMVLMKGMDYCAEWVGDELQSRFGLLT